MDLRIVFFVYGLAFFGLGLAIWQRSAVVAHHPLAGAFRWLALFGLTHGVYEWLLLSEMAGLLPASWSIIEPGLAAASFTALLFFAVGIHSLDSGDELRTGGASLAGRGRSNLLPLVPLGVWLALSIAQLGEADAVATAGILSRYLIGGPAALLAGVMTLRFARKLSTEFPSFSRAWLSSAGGLLLFYGLLTLVAPRAAFQPAASVNYETFERLIGIPVFWFRTFCAMGLALSFGRVLEMFDRLERHRLEVQVEEATGTLLEQQELLNGLLEHTPTAVAVRDLTGRFILVNRAFERIFGVRRGDVLDQTAGSALPEQLARQMADWEGRVVATGEATVSRESVHREEGPIQLLTIRFPIRNTAGEIAEVGIIATDVTEQRRLEEQLAQAQRMEVVGQLTGGIAHDFNNLLAVILGNAELLKGELDRSSPSSGFVDDLLQAADRGATLTRQLLAYSRRQLLSPEVLFASRHVERLSDMLRRTLGETISVTTAHDPDLWSCVADPGQLENALLNLVINARDAMPDGGNVTIETANVIRPERGEEARSRPGRYVCISVSDTGCGMSPAVLEHVFEPFYTTKEKGRGTGLGLSMVFGFIMQSGGDVEIESEEGKGTTVYLYLPAAEATEGSHDESRQSAEVKNPGNGESILLVEDDPAVLAVVKEQLGSLNYRVTTAPDAVSALAILDRGEPVDAVLTDMMLPGGVSGTDLAARLRASDPPIPTVLMSGFVDSGMTGTLEKLEGQLLKKPFSQADLARIMTQLFANRQG